MSPSSCCSPYIDDKFPKPRLGKMEDLPKVGAELMPTRLIEFLTAKPGKEEDEKKAALVKELESINDFLVSIQTWAARHVHCEAYSVCTLEHMMHPLFIPPGQRSASSCCLTKLSSTLASLSVYAWLLQTKGGPFFGGDSVNGLDMELGPKVCCCCRALYQAVSPGCSLHCVYVPRLCTPGAAGNSLLSMLQLKHTIIAVKEIKVRPGLVVCCD